MEGTLPSVSGQEIISETTEKSFRALVLLSATAIITKAYAVPLDEMVLLGARLPAAIFDVTLLATVGGLLYVYIIKWLGDLAAFRLWYKESSIWSNFGTKMKLDKTFIDGGVKLLIDLYEQEKGGKVSFEELEPNTQKEFQDFKANAALYAARLDAAGRKFSSLSCFGHFYVWVQYFVFPVGLAIFASYLLIKYGSFVPPARF